MTAAACLINHLNPAKPAPLPHQTKAALFRPKLIVAGASAYTRHYDYPRMRALADKSKARAVLRVDGGGVCGTGRAISNIHAGARIVVLTALLRTSRQTN
jgi:glycine/serine hydroxymethyltransferase